MRILFVDDERYVLQGLRRLLHSRREWTLLFATGGAEALEVMASGDVDVLVTDMRMPGMDGLELLEIASDRHPDVTRIVLSGYVDDDRGILAAPLAHAWLHKPCDPESLSQAIAARASASREAS